MKASVIVPTYNSEDTIKGCLNSLFNQKFDDKYEVIVVDDASLDNTLIAVEKYFVKILRQKHMGPAAARNLGAKNASGQILLFTDADCVPESNWISEMCAPFKDKQIAGVQGRYKSRQNSITARFSQYEIEERYEIMSKNRYVDFIGSYSAAYNTEVFLGEGGFDEAFSTASGEDADLSYRLESKGLKMVFAPGAVVYHEHPSDILQYLKTKFYRAFWRVALYRKNPKKTIKDSYTPQMLKIQIPLFYLAVIGLFFGSPAILILFAITTIPLSWQILKKDKMAGTFTPVFVFLRSAAFGFGLIFGILKNLKAKI